MSTGTKELTILVRAKDEASHSLERLGFSFQNAEKASSLFAGGLAAGGLAVGALGGMALKAAADMEQMRIGFTTMLGSAKNADVFIRDLVDFAKKTPFELKGLQQASQQLLAYGFTQKEVLPNLKNLGDIASGVGMEKLPNLILAFGQVKAATRLTGMELRQFTEAGVPLLDMLAKQMKVPVSEIQKLVEKGKVGFPEVQQALASLAGEGGRFNNLMQNQSKSLNGMISNLKDAWNIFLMGEGQQLIEWGKVFVALATDIVQNHLSNWVKKIEEVIKYFKSHKEALIIVAGAITGALIPALYAAVSAFVVLAASLAPFIIGGAIIGGIVAGAYWIVTHWDLIKQKTIAVWTSIKDFFAAVWEEIKKLFNDSVNWIIGKIQPLLDIIDKVKSAGSSIGNTFKNVSSSFGFGGARAEGGPVSGSSAYLVGERGPELFVPSSGGSIIPNNKLGGSTINITISGNTLLDSRAGERIGDLIIKRLALNTRLA